MKTKKFAAVLAAAAMMASVIPMQAMAAIPLTSGGAVNYDFEDGTVPSCVLPEMNIGGNKTAKAPDWSAEVVDDGMGNKALKYTFDSHNGEITRSTDNSGALLRLSINPSKWGTDKWFEYSYRYKMDSALNMTSGAFMTLTDRGSLGLMKATYNNGKITVNKASVEPETGKWVTVKTTMYRSADVAASKITAARTTVSYENSEGETVTNVVNEALKGAFDTGWGGVQLLGLSANSANLTDKDSFMIDDIKFSTLDDSDLYTVSFNTNGGNDINSVKTAIGKIDLNWTGYPVKQDCIFDGWYKDEELTQPFDGMGITGDMTAYAKWLSAYKLTFDTGEGGPAVDSILVAEIVGKAHKMPFPKKDGYIFDGWYKDTGYTQLYDGSSVTENTILYAKWTESSDLYNVSFTGRAHPNDLEVIQLTGSNGYWSSEAETDESGNTYMKYTRTHEGTKFVAGRILSFNTIKFPNYPGNSNNLTTTPVREGTGYEIGYKFIPNKSYFDTFMRVMTAMSYGETGKISYWNTYNATAGITAVCGEGKYQVREKITDYGEGFIAVTIVIDPSGAVERDEGGNIINESDLATGEQTIVYKNKSGETVVKKMEFKFRKCDQRQSYGTMLSPITINQPGDTPGDDSFYLDDIYVRPLTAKTVTFVTNDPEITVDPISTVTNVITLPNTEKVGYALSWYKDETFTEPFDGTGITGDMTVYAKWEKIHTVTFVTYGDKLEPIKTTGAIDVSTIIPVKGNLAFDGWYEDEQYNVPFTAAKVEKDMTLYAKWKSELFEADFESADEDYSVWNTVSALDYYSNERFMEENGNYVMKYRYDKNETPWKHGQLAFNYHIPVQLNQDGTTYEFSCKFKPTKSQLLTPTLRLKGQYGYATLFNIDTNNQQTVGYNGNIVGGDSRFIHYDIDGYVTLRAIVNPKDKTASVFVTGRKTDGTEFRVNYDATDVTCKNSNTIDYFAIGSNPYYAPENGTEMLLDDVKLSVAKTHSVTFNYMDGRDDEIIDTNIVGTVALPTPTRENYQFIGWYKDRTFTVPFDGIGVSGDTTVYAFWQTTPTVEKCEPSDGSTNVSTNPTIKIYFDCRMNVNTLDNSTIRVYKDGQAIEPEFYTVQTSDENQKTIAAIQFNHALDFGCTYTVKVSQTVENLRYPMAKEYSMSFTVKNMTLNVSDVAVTDESGNTVTSLKDNAGKKISVSFKITNNSDEAVNYTPILSVMKNGTLTGAAIGTGNSESVEIGLPKNAEDTDELGLMVFDSIGGMKPLTDKTIIK